MRVLVATDRSATAEQAVSWAARLAADQQAELVLLQVAPPDVDGDLPALEASLLSRARELAGERGRAVVAPAEDPAGAIVSAAAEHAADVLVVGNAGMSGRKEFLLGNVPNRVSHAARCTVVIVNTSTGGGTVNGVPVEVEDEDGGGDPTMLTRAAHVARVLGRLGVDLAREQSVQAKARLVRLALQELGPTFAKIGQVLSTRPEMLPAEFIEELSKLQDDVAPMTTREVVTAMEQELRVPWEDVFASIEEQPLAAGSIGQVHRATLETGEQVVVKVQRPAAGEVLADLDLLELFAGKAMQRPAVRNALDLGALVAHLGDSLKRELDFRGEADNLERMAELLEPYSRLAVPRVHRDLSTGRLLVMEAIDGVPLRDAPQGEERIEAATQLLESYCQQVLIEGFFHADPHPGNLRWKDGTIYFLDLGMVGELDGELRAKVVLLLLAFWRGDARFLGEILQMLSDEPRLDPVDQEQLTAELAAAIERFGGGSLAEMELGLMMLSIMDVATRHQIRLPPALALSGKAFSQMQLAAGQLAPALDPFALMSRFLVGNVRRQIARNLDPQALYYSSRKAALRATRLFEAVERASGARPGGGVSVSVSGTQRLEETVERAGRRVAVVLGAGMLALAGAMWHASRTRPVSAAPGGAAAAPSPSPQGSSARRRRRARRSA